MGTYFEMLVDPVVGELEARDVCDAVVTRFRQLGIIEGDLDPECALGGEGYRPGPRALDLYKPKEGQWHPLNYKDHGVEPIVRRNFNYWAIGPVCKGFECPHCRAKIPESDGEFVSAVCEAVVPWLKGSDLGSVACPRCATKTAITNWHCKPPLGIGNLSFSFWNWPNFDAPEWQVDLRKVVAEITGHPVVHTYGKI
jgi:hypothetical protein